MKRKICVITGSRAEYGLLRWLMHGIEEEETLTLQIIVTGMHLERKFGETYKEIESDGFKIDKKIQIISKNNKIQKISNSIGYAITSFGETFEELKPDLVVVLGDRFEIFSAVTAAHVSRIPVAHIHGGEATEGLIDEAFRHAITKMSQLHFVAAEPYRKRVIQLGERPDRTFLVGALGLDGLRNLKLLNKKELESTLGIKFLKKNLLVTFHPVTLEDSTAEKQMQMLLSALAEQKETMVIFTLPNSDPDNEPIFKLIFEFIESNPSAAVFSSVGQSIYFSLISVVDGVIGNSSSGLIEVPSFKKATINIGDRQRGRIAPENVIQCNSDYYQIKEAINEMYSLEFQTQLKTVVNPLDHGGASKKILEIIKNIKLNNIMKKKFYDLGSL